ncbi:MAG: hypothetical protein IKA36_05575 [Clostridia bacterium]|nr:hypothetical protein [Clostridia bacterium]
MYGEDCLLQAPYGIDLDEVSYEVRLGEDTEYGDSLLMPQQDILEYFDIFDLNNNLETLDEASYQERSENAIFRVELLDQEKFIKNNNLKEITNPAFFGANGAPTPDGLLSNEIFGITQSDRSGIFAYIDLGEWFIDPSCYKTLTRLDKKFISIVHATQTYSINSKGELVEDPYGGTGIRWLKENFDKIKFEKADNKSASRDIRVKYVKLNHKNGRLFINKYIVIPPYYRDVNTTGKYTGVGQINTLYVNLITASRSLKENNDYGLSMADTTCARIQETLKNIYDWFCGNNNPNLKDMGTGMSGKFGIIRRANMSKTSDYSSRLVISAPELKVESQKDLMVNLDKSAVPLAAVSADFYPFMMFHMRKFFEAEFQNVNVYPVVGKDGELQYVPVKDPMFAFNDDVLKARLKEFLYSYDNRFIPVKVPVTDDVIKKQGDNFYMVFKGSFTQNEKMDDDPYNTNIERAFRRPLTWCDVIYIAAKKATEGKMTSITRYPFDSYFNTIYTGIEVSSTKETEPLYLNGEYYPFYPKIRREDINQPTGNKFVDTMQICNLYLKGAGADYDGDTVVAKGSFFNETNEEQQKFANSKANFINTGCTNIRISANEAVQSIYNLTKVLYGDENKLTQPEF